MRTTVLFAAVFMLAIFGCKKDPATPSTPSGPTAYSFPQPSNFPAAYLPADNPMTVEGVRLGRHLFYEKRLSVDNTVSCASCHVQDYNFSLPLRNGIGVNGQTTNSVMIHSNLAWQKNFLWNGGAHDIEEVVFHTITDPIEMNNTWEEALSRLSSDPKYVKMFEDAFGANAITVDNACKATAQFVRTFVSANSKFDAWQRGDYVMNASEELGYELFNNEDGDCFHCHGDLTTGNLFGAYGDLQFSNNGVDSILTVNSGREAVTGNPDDRAKFKIPSLRNVEYSFPYMHDGRFQTLQDVIEHYNKGGYLTPTIDPNMKKAGIGRNWTQTKKDGLIDFLKMLTDNSFITDTSFSDPH